MAKTIVTHIPINMSTELDVTSKYNALMQDSIGTESIYLRAEQTMTKFFKEHALTNVDKANIIAEVLSTISSSLSSAAMQAALQWATNEKDLFLRRTELEYQLANIVKDTELKDAQITKMKWDTVAVQSEIIRTYGTPTIDMTDDASWVVTELKEEGKVWEEILLTRAQTSKTIEEVDLVKAQTSKTVEEVDLIKAQTSKTIEEVDLVKAQTSLTNAQSDKTIEEIKLVESKIHETNAAVYKAIAETHTNYGKYTYKISVDGLEEIVREGYEDEEVFMPMAYIQASIAKEQAKGYAWNAWSNAVTSTSSTIGTMLASEAPPPESDVLYSLYRRGLECLLDQPVPTFGGLDKGVVCNPNWNIGNNTDNDQDP